MKATLKPKFKFLCIIHTAVWAGMVIEGRIDRFIIDGLMYMNWSMDRL